MVRKGSNDIFIRSLNYDQREGETPKNYPFCPQLSGSSVHRQQWRHFPAQEASGMFKRVNQPSTEAGGLLFIPLNSFFQLPRSIPANPNLCHRSYEIRFRMSEITSEASSNVAFPVSISLIRRIISLSHASATPCSAGPSKLATKSCARWARSASLKARASSRNTERSRVAIRHLGYPKGFTKYQSRSRHITRSSSGPRTLRVFLRMPSALLRKCHSAFVPAEHGRYV